MPKRFLIAANWKMHDPPKGWGLPESPYRPSTSLDIVVFPTFLHLRECKEAGLIVGAQSGNPAPAGAYTGDVSMEMLKRVGCSFVLCGHSERRRQHGETDAYVAEQAKSALQLGLTPIVCFGETAEERVAGKTKEVITRQMQAISEIFQSDPSKFALAYEPVWAISGGDPNKPAATPQEAQDMHALIRSILPADKRQQIRILYGGSMKASNAEALLKQPDVDGGLVGNASLKVAEFAAIIDAALSLQK